jgi:RimJ/RimL family protein N-acetyltransferase
MEMELFKGKLVRLSAEDPETIADHFSRWSRDSEYTRLLDSGATRQFSVKATKEWIEKELEKDPADMFTFMIRTLEDDCLIGDIGLEEFHWMHGDAYVGIGLGDRDYWGKGYGTDAMKVILRYAFNELNLHRVSLSVFEYNPRAIRSYEKVGFIHEGRVRQYLHKEGRRWDLFFMGITKDEWLGTQSVLQE